MTLILLFFFFDRLHFLHLCDQPVDVAARPRAIPLGGRGKEERPVKWIVLSNRQASAEEYQRLTKKNTFGLKIFACVCSVCDKVS